MATLATASPAAASFGEPVSVTASAPPTVAAGSPFALEVAVAAEAGALDIAAQPLRLRVRLAPECGGSFAGTEGPTAIDRALPAPAAGSAYATTVRASVQLGDAGTETVCAFLEDAQERQFATDTEEELTVVPGCTVASRGLHGVRRHLRTLERRIAHLKRRAHHAPAARRHALQRKLHRLRHRRHRLLAKRRRIQKDAAVACGGRAS